MRVVIRNYNLLKINIRVYTPTILNWIIIVGIYSLIHLNYQYDIAVCSKSPKANLTGNVLNWNTDNFLS